MPARVTQPPRRSPGVPNERVTQRAAEIHQRLQDPSAVYRLAQLIRGDRTAEWREVSR